MPSGGARNRSGPAPDPDALRREKKSDGEWTVLPAEGRRGRAPTWPLTDQQPREKTVWSRLWKRPEALLWERQGQQDLVALYVRRFVEAEEPGSSVALSTLVKQLADLLLLTMPAKLSARVTISQDEVAKARTKKTEKPKQDAGSVRDRMKAIDGGA